MLACDHNRPAFGSPVCTHVQTCRQPWLSYVKWYVGIGMDAELLCVPCADERGNGVRIAVDSICEQCFSHATSEICDLAGVRGAPGILERAESLDSALARTTLPTEFGKVLDFAPVNGVDRSVWLILIEDGRLIRFDAGTTTSMVVGASTVPTEPDHKPFAGHALTPRLHVSRGGEFVAVVNDYGRFGQIIDLRSGLVTLALDGGDYHPETVPISFAFFEIGNRSLAIHRTDWNRLDVSDPGTGQLLTDRGPTRYQKGEERPAHYLDYFHGALHVSPKGSRILDDGWIWHPLGAPATWSLHRWVAENPWESEDGPSKLDACARDYYWDHGCVWIDETRVAVGGIGDDDNAMVDGVRLFDVTSTESPGGRWRPDWRVAREIATFPGPAGSFFNDGGRLFSSEPSGLSRWDLETGARTGRISNFQPTHHHKGARELAQFVEGALVRWTVR